MASDFKIYVTNKNLRENYLNYSEFKKLITKKIYDNQLVYDFVFDYIIARSLNYNYNRILEFGNIYVANTLYKKRLYKLYLLMKDIIKNNNLKNIQLLKLYSFNGNRVKEINDTEMILSEINYLYNKWKPIETYLKTDINNIIFILEY